MINWITKKLKRTPPILVDTTELLNTDAIYAAYKDGQRYECSEIFSMLGDAIEASDSEIHTAVAREIYYRVEARLR